ncbi:MAG: insulinase family protein [Oscillospiraceae bacterium]|nr:insulinase family protein [Oscillospiraceae bacterium]
MTRQLLTDNVYLTYVPSEKFKTSFLSAQMVMPLASRTAGLNALLVNVLSRGTARCPDMDALGRELDMLYGARLDPAVRRKGENQIFGFVASCIDDKYLSGGEKLLEPLTELMGEMLCSPALQDGRLNPAYVESEQANLIDLIRSDVNDKRAYAARRLREEMFAGEPFGVNRLGAAGDVEAITPEQLDRHYRAILPQVRLELFYCGSASAERAAAAYRRALAGLPRSGGLDAAVTSRRAAPAQPRLVTEELDVTQGKLCIGYRTDSPDEHASIVANAMFGGSSNSKLFLNVRERLSLCYYAGSSYDREKGALMVSSGIEFANYDRAMAEIAAQLAAIQRGDWEDWEFTGAKSYLLNNFRSMEDFASSLESYLLFQAVSGSKETLGELMEAVEAVTPERVMEAARAIRPDTIYFLKGKETQE